MPSVLSQAEIAYYQGDYNRAISLYQSRLSDRCCEEERWYCHFMMMRCYLALGHIIKANELVNNNNLCKTRAEPAYYMCKALREKNEHVPAWRFYEIGSKLSLPDMCLFPEPDVYEHKLALEASVLWFYVSDDKQKGLQLAYKALQSPNLSEEDAACVHNNLIYYVAGLDGETISMKPLIYEKDWFYTTPSFCGTDKIYRVVNYRITDEGRYIVYDRDGCVRTRNVWEGQGELTIRTAKNIPYQSAAKIQGLEDMRLIRSGHDIYGLASSMAYSRVPSIVSQVLFRVEGLSIDILAVLSSGANHQKNWVWLQYPYMISDWYPYIVVRKVDANRGIEAVIDHKIQSSPLLRFARGSSNGVLYKGHWWFVIHSAVHHDTRIRHYLHYLIILDKELTIIEKVSHPFTFEKNADIEFCNAFDVNPQGLTFGHSIRDSTPCFKTITWPNLHVELIAQKIHDEP